MKRIETGKRRVEKLMGKQYGDGWDYEVHISHYICVFMDKLKCKKHIPRPKKTIRGNVVILSYPYLKRGSNEWNPIMKKEMDKYDKMGAFYEMMLNSYM